MRVEYEILKEDYEQASRAQGARLKPNRWSRGVSYAAFAAGLIFLIGRNEMARWLAPATLMGCALFFAIEPIWSAYASMDRRWKESDCARNPVMMEVLPTGLRLFTPMIQSDCRWALFKDFVETRDFFLLYSTRSQLTQMILKRAFAAPGQLDEFRRL